MKIELIRIDTERKFDELCNSVRFCTRCIRMENSARVLSRSAGPTNADLMFVGEAPGRLGADVSEIPFHGDKAGHNFEELLQFSRLDRANVFITNAVLCNPRADTGNNATPNKIEIANCSSYLRQQIELVEPSVVVALGAVALEALNIVEPHFLRLAEHVRTSHRWFGRQLIPLYHPGARAMVHRSMANQRSDYQYVEEQLRRLGKKRRVETGITGEGIAAVASEIIRRRGPVTYFALHKLLFLVEYEAWSSLGHRLTNAFFLRQKDGPYCTDLHLAKLRKAIPDLVISGDPARPILNVPQEMMFAAANNLNESQADVIDHVIRATAGLSDAELKTKVYLSAPMRRILRVEKMQFVNLYNTPIRIEPPEPETQSGVRRLG